MGLFWNYTGIISETTIMVRNQVYLDHTGKEGLKSRLSALCQHFPSQHRNLSSPSRQFPTSPVLRLRNFVSETSTAFTTATEEPVSHFLSFSYKANSFNQAIRNIPFRASQETLANVATFLMWRDGGKWLHLVTLGKLPHLQVDSSTFPVGNRPGNSEPDYEVA